ncbi:hypothetical protein [Achromobacter aloeverae]
MKKVKKDRRPLVVMGLVCVDGKVLLRRHLNSDSWEVPYLVLRGSGCRDGMLKNLLGKLGIQAQTDVPRFLAHECTEHDDTLMFGVDAGKSTVISDVVDDFELALFGVADNPWEKIRNPMPREILKCSLGNA